MHAYFRNHQLYLAERAEWLDRHVAKASKRALMKIESWKLMAALEEDDDQVKMVHQLVRDSLLNIVPNKTVLSKEGFFVSNLHN